MELLGKWIRVFLFLILVLISLSSCVFIPVKKINLEGRKEDKLLVIRNEFIEKTIDTSFYIQSSDTLIKMIYEYKDCAIYEFGNSRGSHNPAEYYLVYYFKHQLMSASNYKSKKAQLKILRMFENCNHLYKNDSLNFSKGKRIVLNSIKENKIDVGAGVW